MTTYWIVWNQTRRRVLAENGMMARTFYLRLKGLLGTRELQAGSAMILTPCGGIHTFGMTYPLDVIFCNRAGVVIKIVAKVRPGSMLWVPGAVMAIEMPAGSLVGTGTRVGDWILLENKGRG